MVGFKNDPY